MVRSRVAADVQTKGHEGAVFVNLTVADLVDPNLFATEAPLSRIADRVVLELTEREGLDTVPDLARRVERLRQVGYRIAVDDLGGDGGGLVEWGRVGAVETVKGSRLPRELFALVVQLRDALVEFLTTYPNLELNVYVIVSDELVAGVIAEQIGAEVVQCS